MAERPGTVLTVQRIAQDRQEVGLDQTGAGASVSEVAARIDRDIRALPLRNTPNVRTVRRRYSRECREADGPFILELARELVERYGHRWVAYELVGDHQEAFRSVGEGELEALGRGIDSWGAVDAFARTLAGPAWRDGQLSGDVIDRWARRDDRWWRRAALVSTVALNVRSRGGTGDVLRTLSVCGLLAGDDDDMVVKALSWALRELVVHDPQAVETFLRENEQALAPRVLREVRNKLVTGLKNPKRAADGTGWGSANPRDGACADQG